MAVLSLWTALFSERQPPVEIISKLKLKVGDPISISDKKLQLLQSIVIHHESQAALKEIIWVAQKWPKRGVRALAIKVLGEAGRSMSTQKERVEGASQIVDILIGLLKTRDELIMTESIVALQKMIVRESDQSHGIIVYCVRTLDKISSGRAKAIMI